MSNDNTDTKPEGNQTTSDEGLDGAACSSPLFCECVNWCRDGRDMFSPHHPHCAKYTPPPADPRLARFGAAVWKHITDIGGEFCGSEISEDILPLAESAGLCCRVEYDPKNHGEIVEADPGDEIWWWGDSWMNVQGDGSPDTNTQPTR